MQQARATVCARADTQVSDTLYGRANRPCAMVEAPGWGWCRWRCCCRSPPPGWWGGWPALLGVLAACVALMAIQSRHYEVSKQWERFARHAAAICSGRMCALAGVSTCRPRRGSVSKRQQAGGQADARGIERSLLRYLGPMVDTVVAEYGDWLLLKNIKRYFRTRQLVAAAAGLPARQLVDAIAALEADLALARHLRTVSVFCWAGDAAPGAR